MEDKVTQMIKEEDVVKRINELAAKIDEDCKGEELFIVCILRGLP